MALWYILLTAGELGLRITYLIVTREFQSRTISHTLPVVSGVPQQGWRKAFRSGGLQRLNRINLYGKNPISVEKL